MQFAIDSNTQLVVIDQCTFAVRDMLDAMDDLYTARNNRRGIRIRDPGIALMLRDKNIVCEPSEHQRYRIKDYDEYDRFFDAFMKKYCTWRMSVLRSQNNQ